MSEVKLSVAFILLPEFTLSAFSGFADAMRLAASEVDNSQQIECNWTIIAPDLNPIKSNCGIEIAPWEKFEDAGNYDYIIVIGGLVEPQRKTDIRILDFIKGAADDGQFIVSVCTATFVLARIGVMNGFKCCVHWYHRPEFEEEFPEIAVDSDTIFLQDRNRISCPGGTTSYDVGLHLIEKHCGPAKARKVASGLVIEDFRDYRSPQPHAEVSWFGTIPDPFIRRVILVMDKYVTAPLTMVEISQKLNISENTLYRKFENAVGVSPAKLLRVLRLAHGHRALHKTSLAISQIAQNYQFSDASHFTRIHNKYFNTTPAKARGLGVEGCQNLIDHKAHQKIIGQILVGELFILSEGDTGF